MSAEWKNAMSRAALPLSCRVEFLKSTKASENTVSYSLSCFDKADMKIGDDRDYDILKAVMTPLERLSEDAESLSVVLDLNSGSLDIKS